jgi:hypothetical protein
MRGLSAIASTRPRDATEGREVEASHLRSSDMTFPDSSLFSPATFKRVTLKFGSLLCGFYPEPGRCVEEIPVIFSLLIRSPGRWPAAPHFPRSLPANSVSCYSDFNNPLIGHVQPVRA